MPPPPAAVNQREGISADLGSAGASERASERVLPNPSRRAICILIESATHSTTLSRLASRLAAIKDFVSRTDERAKDPTDQISGIEKFIAEQRQT